MATTNKESKLSTDIFAAGLLGLLAGVFASITLANLGVIGTSYFGVTVSIWLVVFGFLLVCTAGIVVGRILGKFAPILYNIAKFGEAGGLNWLVDMGVVNLLILLTGFSAGLYFILFKALSFLMAATNSYFWNKLWVFSGSKKQDQGREVSKFVMATSLGLLLNVIVAAAINFFGPNVFSGVTTAGWANLATIAGSLFAMIFNFVLYKIWVFKS